MAECDDRTHRRADRRLNAAGFPRPKRLEDFDFTANPAINPAPSTSSPPANGSATASRCV